MRIKHSWIISSCVKESIIQTVGPSSNLLGTVNLERSIKWRLSYRRSQWTSVPWMMKSKVGFEMIYVARSIWPRLQGAFPPADNTLIKLLEHMNRLPNPLNALQLFFKLLFEHVAKLVEGFKTQGFTAELQSFFESSENREQFYTNLSHNFHHDEHLAVRHQSVCPLLYWNFSFL